MLSKRCSKYLMLVLAISCIGSTSMVARADIYELRTYTANEGKLEALHKRFREHTIALFRKHGMESLGYWVPTDKPKSSNVLIYILKHDSRETAQRSFQSFLNDPEWKKVYAESEKDGPILSRPPESVFMELTDYSPVPSIGAEDVNATFELRTYTLHDGKRPLIDARTRDHAIRYFERHGMASVGYWHPVGQEGAANTFMYMLRHENRDAAARNRKAIRGDQEWAAVRKETEIDGGFIAKIPKSIFLTLTNYSPLLRK